MHRPKMTNSAVEKFTCREGKEQDTLWCGELKGFGMKLSRKNGTRTYFLLYRVRGRKQQLYITIGRHNDPWRVDQARAKALELKARMVGGVDPVAEAERKRKEDERQLALNAALGTTLQQVLEHYIQNKRTKHGPLRPATKADLRRSIEVNLSDWCGRPVAEITRDMCLVKFTEMSEHAPSAANATMIYLRALLNYAREMHATEDGQFPILAVNPVTRLFKLRKPNPQKRRETRIPLAKVGVVWLMLRRRAAEARNVLDRTAADWVSTMLITGLRLTESGSLQWINDVDLENRTVRLRGDLVKNHNGVTLPMSTALHEILTARRELRTHEKAERRRRRQIIAETYVFASNGRKCPYMTDPRATMEAVSKVAGCHITPQDLRRTAEDIAKAVKVDSDERRQLLNHLASDVHGQHYANNPDPTVLAPGVEAIARFVTDAAKVAEAQESGANVLAFPSKAAN